MSRVVDRRLAKLMADALDQSRLLVPQTNADALALVRRVRRGTFVRPFPGMYAEKTAWEALVPREQYGHIIHTYAYMHPETVFAGISALFLRGMVSYEIEKGDYRIETVTPSRSHSASSMHVRRICLKSGTRGLATFVKGLRVITVEKSLVDLAHTRGVIETVGYAYDCVAAGLITCDQMRKALKKLAWFKGLRALREVLSLLNMQVDNAGEAKVYAKICRLGYEPPQVQVSFVNPKNYTMPYRVDFCWNINGAMSVLELDGIKAKREQQVQSKRQAARVLNRSIERTTDLLQQGVSQIKHLTYGEAMTQPILELALRLLGVRRVVHQRGVAGHRK